MMMIAGLAPDSNGAAVLWVDDQQGGQALADVEVTFGKGNSLKLFLLQIQQGSQPLPPDISREHGAARFVLQQHKAGGSPLQRRLVQPPHWGLPRTCRQLHKAACGYNWCLGDRDLLPYGTWACFIPHPLQVDHLIYQDSKPMQRHRKGEFSKKKQAVMPRKMWVNRSKTQ